MPGISSLIRARWSGVERTIALAVAVLLVLVVAEQIDGMRERRRKAEMQSALTSFALAQESYFHDHAVYGDDLISFADRGFVVSPEATIVVNEATAVGWSATASHSGTVVRCFLYVRVAAPVGVADREGAIRCG